MSAVEGHDPSAVALTPSETSGRGKAGSYQLTCSTGLLPAQTLARAEVTGTSLPDWPCGARVFDDQEPFNGVSDAWNSSGLGFAHFSKA